MWMLSMWHPKHTMQPELGARLGTASAGSLPRALHPHRNDRQHEMRDVPHPLGIEAGIRD